MIDKEIIAFQLPTIRLTEKWDFDLNTALKELQGSQLFFTAFQDEKDNLKILHFGFNEEMYALMQASLHTNIKVYDFLKLSLINAEKFRNGEMNEAFEMMTRAVEYINFKNSKHLTL